MGNVAVFHRPEPDEIRIAKLEALDLEEALAAQLRKLYELELNFYGKKELARIKLKRHALKMRW